MKLRNKKTGEIINNNGISFAEGNYNTYSSLAELNEEWEDYLEPKELYWVNYDGSISHAEEGTMSFVKQKQIGNYFETKEEAEKALEKLKAWKRLKDKGFHFLWWNSTYKGDSANFYIDWIEADSKDEIVKDLDLLFGGEE